MLPLRITFAAAISGFLIPLAASANEEPLPPLNADTFVGVWEAVPQAARLIYHMEINKSGDSYLAMIPRTERFLSVDFSACLIGD
jgi:hypothetical protein